MYYIFKIEIIIGTIIIFCSLAISFYIRLKLIANIHFNFFFLYPLLAFTLSIITIISHYFFSMPRHFVNSIENSFCIIENIFWGYFFLSYIKNKELRTQIKRIFTLTLLTILTLVVVNGFSNPNFKFYNFYK